MLILSLGLIVYSSSFGNPFIWDDETLIIKNSYIRSWENLSKIFTSPLFHSSRFKTFFFRPLQELSYTLDFHFWQLSPVGYHLSSILLHAINAILLFFIISRITKNFPIALFSSLIFVIHPIHTQAVTYISGRADLLVGLFLLLAFLSYVESFYLLCIIFFILGLLSKESAIVFPFILILYDASFRKGENRFVFWRKYLPFFIITILAYLYFRSFFLGLYDYKLIASSAGNFLPRIFSIGKIVFIYLGLLVYPANLQMERSLTLPESFLEPSCLLPFAGLIFIIAVFFAVYKHSKTTFPPKADPPLAGFFLGWFFICLSPMLNVLKLDTLIAEHWVYLASPGIFVLWVLGLRYLIRSRFLFYFTLALLLIFYSSFTIRRNIEWGNKLAFCKHTLDAAPNSLRANYLFGQVLLEEEMYPQAIVQFKKVIRLKGNESDTYNILGVAYIRSKEAEKAKTAFEKSIELDPRYADPVNNLGLVYLSENKDALACQKFKEALTINPRHLATMNNLGLYHKKKGKKDLAAAIWKKVLSIDPMNQNAQKNLYKIKKETGQ